MSTVQRGSTGLAVLIDLNLDRVLFAGGIMAALGASVALSTLF
ncbi:hypothetical protein [Aliiroseovarius sp. 2305UL8-7]